MKPRLLPALMLVPGLWLVGCGTGEAVDASRLAEAVDETREAGTSRVAIADEGKSVSVGEGEVDYAGQRARFSLETTYEAGRREQSEIVVIGTEVFMHSEPPVIEMEKRWVRYDTQEDPPALDELVLPLPFIDLSGTSALIRDSEAPVVSLGEQMVRGVEANGYRVTIDLAKAIERAPQAHREELRARLAESAEKTRGLELWVDGSGLVRRVKTTQSHGSLTLDFFDFGLHIDVQAPPEAEVATFEEAFGLPSLRADSTEKPSARFVSKESFAFQETTFQETTTGSFDWGTRMGRAVIAGGGQTREIIQVGDECYEREGQGEWTRSDVPANAVDDTCDDVVFLNPATADNLLKFVAGAKSVGMERVRGVDTTHFKGALNIGAVQGPIEYWVDAEGNTRKTLQPGAAGDSLTEWFDFGVEVHVQRPAVQGRG